MAPDPATPPETEELLSRCSFPPAGTRVTLAVSGGPDSMALLALACAAGLEAVAVHVDHGLRHGSDAEPQLVERAATHLGAGFESRTVAVEPGPDLEARARRARYAVLPPGVMTGHTMDDQAETMLINLLRGAGLDGLAGMLRASPPGALRPQRPLLGLRRTETTALCDSLGLDVVHDPSNDDPAFVRNRLRSEVLPLLCEVAGRDVVPVLARQAELIAGEADLLDGLAAGLDPRDARALREAPAPLARRAVRGWLRSTEEMHPPSAAEVARVMAVAEGLVRACELSGGRRVARSEGRLRLEGAPVYLGGAPAGMVGGP